LGGGVDGGPPGGRGGEVPETGGVGA
jgi:hypothetical protein